MGMRRILVVVVVGMGGGCSMKEAFDPHPPEPKLILHTMGVGTGTVRGILTVVVAGRESTRPDVNDASLLSGWDVGPLVQGQRLMKSIMHAGEYVINCDESGLRALDVNDPRE